MNTVQRNDVTSALLNALPAYREMRLIDSPVRQRIDGEAVPLNPEKALLDRLYRGPLFMEELSDAELVLAYRLTETGAVLAWPCGERTRFYHPDDREGTGYIKTKEGKPINGGYGFLGPNGDKLDPDGNPWLEPCPVEDVSHLVKPLYDPFADGVERFDKELRMRGEEA